MLIREVAWAIQPHTQPNVRSWNLLRELHFLGAATAQPLSYFHGAARGVDESIGMGRFRPGRKLARFRRSSDRDLAVMSPVFSVRAEQNRLWTDLYDDWSIAPDINPAHRLTSSRTYKGLAREAEPFGVVTCNSEYMRAKLRLPVDSLVPNGVDVTLSAFARTSDQARRLVVLGHFFKGRTDFDLLRDVIRSGRFDEIVIGAPGNSKEIRSIVADLRRSAVRLVVRKWIDHESLAALVGARTVALIPHKVTDYTLSQDLMKIYQFLALGIRVICPRLLWPPHVSIEYAFLLDFGIRLEETLTEWIDETPPSDVWRINFAQLHSWTSRASSVAAKLSTGVR